MNFLSRKTDLIGLTDEVIDMPVDLVVVPQTEEPQFEFIPVSLDKDYSQTQLPQPQHQTVTIPNSGNQPQFIITHNGTGDININTERKQKLAHSDPNPPDGAVFQCAKELGDTDEFCETYCVFCEEQGAEYSSVGIIEQLPPLLYYPVKIIGTLLGFGGGESERTLVIQNDEEEEEDYSEYVDEKLAYQDEPKQQDEPNQQDEPTVEFIQQREVIAYAEPTFINKTVEQVSREFEIERLKAELEYQKVLNEEMNKAKTHSYQEDDEIDSYSIMLQNNPQFRRA